MAQSPMVNLSAPGDTDDAFEVVRRSLTPLPDERDAEAARLEAVRRYRGMPVDGTLDRVTAIAARVCHTPMALVGIVDEDRIWMASHQGFDAETVEPRPGSCASAALHPGLTILEDAALDPVGLTNPLVAAEFGLRFYAAAPILTYDGHNLGSLCVMDRKPRRTSEGEMAVLVDLASVVAEQLELRLAAHHRAADPGARFRGDLATRRLDHEVADVLRRALVPSRLPAISGMEVAALYRPTDPSEVGGDFYDVFPVGPRAWGVVIGDVCGKGPAAAALTAAARHAVRAAAVEHSSPAQVLSVVNQALLIEHGGDDDNFRFATVAYARIGAFRDGFRLSVACGGHPPPLLFRGSGQVESAGVSGTLLGLFDDAPCEDRRTYLRSGDVLLFYTDGLLDAPTPSGMTSPRDLSRALHTAGGSAAALIKFLDEAMVSETPQRDDIAVVALGVEPPIERGA